MADVPADVGPAYRASARDVRHWVGRGKRGRPWRTLCICGYPPTSVGTSAIAVPQRPSRQTSRFFIFFNSIYTSRIYRVLKNWILGCLPGCLPCHRNSGRHVGQPDWRPCSTADDLSSAADVRVCPKRCNSGRPRQMTGTPIERPSGPLFRILLAFTIYDYC